MTALRERKYYTLLHSTSFTNTTSWHFKYWFETHKIFKFETSCQNVQFRMNIKGIKSKFETSKLKTDHVSFNCPNSYHISSFMVEQFIRQIMTAPCPVAEDMPPSWGAPGRPIHVFVNKLDKRKITNTLSPEFNSSHVHCTHNVTICPRIPNSVSQSTKLLHQLCFQ